VLVLTRRVDESIVIGDNIKITVVAMKNGAVKLGIDVPREVPILRTELIPKTKFDLNAQREKLGANHSSSAPAAKS